MSLELIDDEHLCDYGCGKIANYRFENKKYCCSDNISKCEQVKKVILSKSKNCNKFVYFENTEEIKCDFGCGKIANYKSGNNKYCCNEFHSRCENVIKKKIEKSTGQKRSKETCLNISKSKIGRKSKFPNKNKGKSYTEIFGENTEDILKNISLKNKIKIKDIRRKYSFFDNYELRYDPEKPEEFIIQYKCDNCRTWFSVRRELLYERIRNIKAEFDARGMLFCSEDCRYKYKRKNRKQKNINIEHKLDYYEYRLKVDRLTAYNVRKYKKLIKDIELRGTKTGYHLDHKLSVKFGFDNKIDAEIIAHACNLEILKIDINQSKHDKSSITLIKLLEEIKNFNNKLLIGG